MTMRSRLFKIKYKDILYWTLWICLTQGIFSSYFGFSQINYLCDLLLILLLVVKVASKKIHTVRLTERIECVPILLFFLIAFIGWCLNTVPFPMALWGVRNYGRFFLYFIVFPYFFIRPVFGLSVAGKNEYKPNIRIFLF